MDKSKREKDRLYEIACTNRKSYYDWKACGNDSYFIKRDNDVYIRIPIWPAHLFQWILRKRAA